MISNKNISAITAALLCVCLILCVAVVYAEYAFDMVKIPEYQTRMFGDEIIKLDIQADRDDWQTLLDRAQKKEWISADIVINGERFNTVGIRTKGNSSLSQTVASAVDKYSLQIKFNKYVKGQTYYGLDTFCINNVIGDATYMKDYISYDIMKFIGVDTPLTNYANVTVNGDDYGFCLALERYDKAFLDRVYSTSAGQLYSVKIGMGMRGNFEDMWRDIVNDMPDRQENGGDFGNRRQGGGAGGSGDLGGGSLLYIGDNISSYSAIFDNAVFGNATDEDKQRVITAIESLNTGTDLGRYFDVDEILRYLAAHTTVVNLDSYSSNMQQNYYIYERDGKISILPWDYGLAFGGFQSSSASNVVNFPIDTPVSGVSMEDRPLINRLLEEDEYLERYHSYLRDIVEGYFESGLYESTISALDTKINQYVNNDSSAFYTYEQYETSLPHLIELGRLRAESIKGQLHGTIPSTSGGQNVDSSSLIDASSVNLPALGSMMRGGGIGQGARMEEQEGVSRGADGQPADQGNRPDMPGGQGVGIDGPGSNPPDRSFDAQGGGIDGILDTESMQRAMQIILEAGGALTDEARDALLDLGITEEQLNMFARMQNGIPGGRSRQGGPPDRGGQNTVPEDGNNGAAMENTQNNNTIPRQGISQPDGNNDSAPEAANSSGKYIIAGVLFVLLISAIIFVAKPHKNAI